ncbi:hypothetical protein A9R01_03850 ['Osedax' symbiont bacterium Rs2_46_30_T18]|nr:hypothetical protein A9R01_03850 ['Osedax' symbiont bacterium Rs2_46_30_T18]
MTTTRRPFRRASEEERRTSLIEATMECIVQGGIGAATIRRVAEIADVTPGLVRHYFPDKNTLLCAAHKATMSKMTTQAIQSLDNCDGGPLARLRLFIETSLQAPVVHPRNYQLWASFTSLINAIPEIGISHREAYIEFRNECESLVRDVFAEQQRDIDDKQVERYAIAVNALIDGLWLEGCLAMDLFDSGSLSELGVKSVQSLLDLETL